MNHWSDEARNELERFLVAERGWLAQDPEQVDVDHEEVIADLRAHVREELAVAGAEHVELDDLLPVLQSLRPGFGTEHELRPLANKEPQGSPEVRTPRTPRERRAGDGPGPRERAARKRFSPVAESATWVFGVILPALALFVELSDHTLAEATGLDPIPGLWNVLLIALVPIMNAIMLVRDRSRLGPIAMGFAGAALATTLLYSIVFLPLVPIGLFAILVVGVGFLVLSPQASLLATWALVRRSRREGASKGALVGGTLAMLLLALGTILSMVTNLGADWATDEDPIVRARGLEILRSFGSEERLLAYCYSSGNLDFVTRTEFGINGLLESGLIEPPTELEARELYYLVTGRAYNSVDPPSKVLDELQGRGWDADGWRRRNSEQRARGGTEVAGRIEDLDLVESRIDAQLETEAALFYLEWELEFANGTDVDHEARAQVQLPPGGYVSRLTLWVNGEEREAAFDETGKVRQAYQEVAVVQRRDPVLVTHSGADQVLVQCFPVPAGGKLRTRVGITAPLLLAPDAESPGGPEGSLNLPRFVERNFGLAPALEHQVWLQGRGEYLALPDGLTAADPGDGQRLARGSLPAAQLDSPGSATRVALEGLAAHSWAPASPQGAAAPAPGEPELAVVQSLVEVEAEPVDRLVVVLDGGAGLEAAGEALAFALDYVPAEVELGLIVAGAPPTGLEAPGAARPSRLEALERALEDHDFAGGIDAAPALTEAFDLAQAEPGGAVVWLHGAQPVTFTGTSALNQRLERSRGGTRIHALAAAPGANRLIAEHGSQEALVRVPRTGALTDDLVRLLRELTVGARGLAPMRERVAMADLPAGAQPASQQLTRLWAGDEAMRLLAIPKVADRKAGVELALAHHLVTPRTGAVVLETQAQFDRHGLKPVTIDEVPSVPEPEMIALLLLVAALLGFAVLRGRMAG